MRLLITGSSGFIGTNLVEHFRTDGTVLVNLDVAPPLCPDHQAYWRRVDVLDRPVLIDQFRAFAPTDVIHLAARTDCDGKSLDDYRQNTDGTANILAAIEATPSVRRAIITSTQFVCRAGYLPRSDTDCAPDTTYGESKVVTEQLTRDASMHCTWAIIRPTTIWGPWLSRHRDVVFPTLRRRLYLHPGRKPCMRSWGYVGNVVFQIRRLLELPDARIQGQTIYVGDPVRDLRLWVDGFSRRLTGRGVREVPRGAVRAVAIVGDLLQLCGKRFPLTSSRYRSMTRDYPVPMERTWKLLGEPPYSLEDAITETLQWLDQQGSCPNLTPPKPVEAQRRARRKDGRCCDSDMPDVSVL